MGAFANMIVSGVHNPKTNYNYFIVIKYTQLLAGHHVSVAAAVSSAH